jgi:2-methylisocitrate lyase-like PEP mutase family enzyme
VKHKVIFAVALSAIAVVGPLPSVSMAATSPVPCEKSLSDLKAAVASAKLSDADAAKVTDLEGKGLERCKADDDAGADAFFADAMKLLGK